MAARSLFFLVWIVSIAATSYALGAKYPVADHHMHLQSPMAANLLNQGGDRADGGQREHAATAKDLIAALDAAHIERAAALSDAYRLGSPFVHVPNEAEAVERENEWTAAQVRQYPTRLMGFCSVNPLRSYAMSAIQRCSQLGLHGLKLHLANSRFNFERSADVKKLERIFALANRLHMAIIIHLRTDEKWNSERSVRLFVDKVLPMAPDVPVQVAHMGAWGGYDRSTDTALQTFISSCRSHRPTCRHLFFDISVVVLDPAATDRVDRLLAREQQDFPQGPYRLAANIRKFGIQRILFGSDFPDSMPAEYEQLLRTELKLKPGEVDQLFSNVAPYFGK